MSTSLRAAIAALVVFAAFVSGVSAGESGAPQGYVLLKGEDARHAAAGTLLRIGVREVVRKDGSKATVYRDVDYPVRVVKSDVVEPKKENADGDDAEKEEKPIEQSVYVFFGPEYEDPPPPGTSPSPNRLRRAGPALVKYEWDELKDGGTGDEALRLELDFSGTKVEIKAGYWQMEAEAGEVEKDTKPGFDFYISQGAYGSSDGTIVTRDLHLGPPDVIEVALVPTEKERSAKTYRLKRLPAE